jgi:hypothetical protein
MIDIEKIRAGLDKYNEGKYGAIDEAFFQYIGRGIKERGYLTPIDLFCVICWKMWNIPRALDLAFESIIRNHEDNKDVQKITREAIELAEKGKIKEAVENLKKLYGVRVKVASAILTFYDPENYGVIDKHAWKALYGSEIDDPTPEQYCNYLRETREIAKKYKMKTHEIDAALYEIGKSYSLGTSPDAKLMDKSEAHSDDIDKAYPFKTRGSPKKRKAFNYSYNSETKRLYIHNSEGREDVFSLQEIENILISLYEKFGTQWFPLANNVEKMGYGTEQEGFGMTILKIKPRDIKHAQASSYLGVVLENLGILEWNGKTKGIRWRIIVQPEAWNLEQRLLHPEKYHLGI